MMKTLLEFLCFAYLLTLAMGHPVRYDNIDIDEVLNNQWLYKKYFDCLANIGRCSPDGMELKEMLPEILASGCEKCSEKQKLGGEKVLKFMIEKKPEDFLILEKIYDLDHAYRRKFAAEAEKIGVKLI